MSSNIQIIEANIKDLELIRLIASATFRSTYEATSIPKDMELYLRTYFNKKRMRSEIKNSKAQFFLMWDNQELVGYSKLRWDKIDPPLKPLNTVNLERIYFQKNQQRKGLGTMMLDFLVNWSRVKNYEVLWLTVWPENPKAVNFYKKYGFTIYGTLPFDFAGKIEEDYAMKFVINS